MNKIILKLLLFLSPFILISFLLVLVDPYNLFNVSRLYSDEVKLKCINRSNESIPRGTILWKTIDFRRNPSPNIILGDSRAAYISNAALEKNFNGKASNMAIAGGNYRAVIELFWMAAKTTKLENVIIQVNFDTYNVEGSSFNLYTPAKQVINKPSSYFFSIDFLSDAFAVVYYSISQDEEFVGRGFMRTGDNWARTNQALNTHYNLDNYQYPEGLKSELAEISNFCRNENINLAFVIPPDYYEVNDFIEESGITAYYNQFETDLKKIGKTIDLNTKMPFSLKKDNYADHFHIRHEIADTLVSMIFENGYLN